MSDSPVFQGKKLPEENFSSTSPSGGWGPAILFFMVLMASVFGVISGADVAQGWRCPVGTFWHRGSDNPFGLLILTFAVAFGIGPAVTLWLYLLFPGTRTDWNHYEKHNPNSPFTLPAVQKWLSRAAMVSAVVAVPFMFRQVVRETCLTSSAIWNQTSTLGRLNRYTWDDISRVAINCEYVQNKTGGYWSANRLIYLRNGTYFGFSGESDWAAFSQINRSLHGHRFTFDTSGVPSRCRANNLPVLLERP